MMRNCKRKLEKIGENVVEIKGLTNSKTCGRITKPSEEGITIFQNQPRKKPKLSKRKGLTNEKECGKIDKLAKRAVGKHSNPDRVQKVDNIGKR